jgi:hypothetical protein
VEPLSAADQPAGGLASGQTPAQARLWQARVWQRWPGGHLPQLARLLADDLVQLPGFVINLDQETVRRILRQINLRPAGLKQLLGRLVEAGLLVQLQAEDEHHWGRYGLMLPEAPGAPDAVNRPALEDGAMTGLGIVYCPPDSKFRFIWTTRTIRVQYGRDIQPVVELPTPSEMPAAPPFAPGVAGFVKACRDWLNDDTAVADAVLKALQGQPSRANAAANRALADGRITGQLPSTA